MIMAGKILGSLIDPKKKEVVLQRIKDGKAPFCAAKPAPETIAKPMKKGKITPDEKKDMASRVLCNRAILGECDQIAKLLARGADVNFRDNIGKTPLIYAAMNGHVDAVKMLIKAGAKINLANKGMTAMTWAAQYGHAGVIECLIDEGASVNRRDRNGRTALMHAAYYAKASVIEALLNHGADPNIKDRYGMAAIHWARSSTKPFDYVVAMLNPDSNEEIVNRATGLANPVSVDEVVKLLKKHGATE